VRKFQTNDVTMLTAATVTVHWALMFLHVPCNIAAVFDVLLNQTSEARHFCIVSYRITYRDIFYSIISLCIVSLKSRVSGVTVMPTLGKNKSRKLL